MGTETGLHGGVSPLIEPDLVPGFSVRLIDRSQTGYAVNNDRVQRKEKEMLTKKQRELYDSFYRSTQKNEHLDQKTEVLVGLSAAMAMNCSPCTRYYLDQAKTAKIPKGAISEVLAKVMAVAAGQKRLQLKEVIEDYGIDLKSYE